MTGLFFTDAHVTPGENLRRFSWLGNYILKKKPALIVQGGDFGSFNSFSHWDKDKRLLIEGRRFQKDVEACRDALHLMTQPIDEYNRKRSKAKKAQYVPKVLWFEGNHEAWIGQYIERHPELSGVIDLYDNLKLYDFFDNVEIVPFEGEDWFREVEGVFFCHAPRHRTGLISSKYIADRALEVFDGSVFHGHTHRLVYSSYNRIGSNGVYQSLCGGCFFENTPEYAVGHNNDYWRGIIEFTLLGNGKFDFNMISMEQLYVE